MCQAIAYCVSHNEAKPGLAHAVKAKAPLLVAQHKL